MFGRKDKLKRALENNMAIHNALVAGVADKYIAGENPDFEKFDGQLLGRAINWAIPYLRYSLEEDINNVANKEIRERLLREEDKIYEKGLAILNSDSDLEKVITHYVAYSVFLLEALFSSNTLSEYSGFTRMKKLLFQTTEPEPVVSGQDFIANYKGLFKKFNENYLGKYDKPLDEKLVDSLFAELST